jgi:1-phosphofructokinase
MIFTVTLNPSIDYVIEVNNFSLGEINRVVKEDLFPGGKGINVSLILHNLGIVSRPLGFYAGQIGENIVDMIREKGVSPEFTKVSNGSSRINIKMKDKEETQINGIGPTISDEDIASFYEKLTEIKDGDILILSGSIPSSIRFNIYAEIMKQLKGRDVNIIVDTSGPALRECFQYHPFLVKPNIQELEGIYDQKAVDLNGIISLATKAQNEGARNVIVSLGSEGGLLLTETGIIDKQTAPDGKVVNTVGSGDSMVAGFVAGWLRYHGDYLKSFHLALAAGSATAFSKDLATGQAINEVFNKEGF